LPQVNSWKEKLKKIRKVWNLTDFSGSDSSGESEMIAQS
jgi:hypothetical protein